MPWAAQQTKVRSKLAIQRIRTTIEKNNALAKRQRREVASLLEAGKIETARLRTESLIQQDQHNELLELLELYLELILARFALLELNPKEKVPDEGVREAVCSVVYAAPRTEIRELHIIREAFMSRYGREWALSCMENADNQVSPRIISKCKLGTPAKDWVDLYLYEISKAYQINWHPEGVTLASTDEETAAHEQQLLEAELDNAKATSEKRNNGADNDDDNEDDDDDNGGNLAEKLPSTPSVAPRLGNVKNSTSVVPIVLRPSGHTETHTREQEHSKADRFTLPAIPPTDPTQSGKTVVIRSNIGSTPSNQTSSTSTLPASKPAAADTTYADLARRFEALKRK